MYDELVKWLRSHYCGVHAKAFKDAADAIEDLQDKFKTLMDKYIRLTAHTEWIPVTERLPEERQRVLAIILYKTRPRSSYYRLVYFSNNLESVDNFDFEGESRCGFYYYDSEYGFCEVDDVTHWMPLPDPPKDGEQ